MWTGQGGAFIQTAKIHRLSVSPRPDRHFGATNVNYFYKLCDDLIEKVFSFLNVASLCSIAQVSRRFQKISERNSLWKPLYERDYDSIYIDDFSLHSFKHWFRQEYVNRQLVHMSFRYRPTKGGKKATESCCLGSRDIGLGRRSGDLVVNPLTAKQKLQSGIKVVMLGDAATGKTCLLIRFAHNRFEENSECTIGACMLVKKVVIENTPLKFEIWDTAGQERYAVLAPTYYRHAMAGIVIYDISNTQSYNKAKKWISELHEHGTPQMIIALVGNKLDLDARRQVSTEMASRYAKEEGLIFFEVSAKTGHNVIELFKEIARKLISATEIADVVTTAEFKHEVL